MRILLKSVLSKSPIVVKKNLIILNEFYFYCKALSKEKKEYPFLEKNKKTVKNILIYHISGMFYAGTEKNLQLIANQLVEEYNVFFMYSKNNFSQRQKDLMDTRINFIEFTYGKQEKDPPHFITQMNPHIKQIISRESIDLIITSSSGRPEYPMNTVRNIPIITINVFGAPSLQANTIATIFISKTIQDYSEQYTGKKNTNSFAYLPIAKPIHKEIYSIRDTVRLKLGIPKDAFVFGRIGRGSDSIFDPIGINAFEKIVKKYKNAYYLIMSPPPILKQIVEDRRIPNVHYMQDTQDIWDFYYSIDALAHFRLDGETFGLNIVEAMYAGNPIISHSSHIWNAHLEYLLPSFSRITKKDDTDQYAAYMEEYILLREVNLPLWNEMRMAAEMKAKKDFNKEDYGNNIKKIIQSLS